MTFKLTIDCDSAAFGDKPHVEVGRILSRLSEHVAAFGDSEGPIRDVNGNKVGRWTLGVDA